MFEVYLTCVGRFSHGAAFFPVVLSVSWFQQQRVFGCRGARVVSFHSRSNQHASRHRTVPGSQEKVESSKQHTTAQPTTEVIVTVTTTQHLHPASHYSRPPVFFLLTFPISFLPQILITFLCAFIIASGSIYELGLDGFILGVLLVIVNVAVVGGAALLLLMRWSADEEKQQWRHKLKNEELELLQRIMTEGVRRLTVTLLLDSRTQQGSSRECAACALARCSVHSSRSSLCCPLFIQAAPFSGRKGSGGAWFSDEEGGAIELSPRNPTFSMGSSTRGSKGAFPSVDANELLAR